MVRVTEAAALLSSVYLGRGDKEIVDQRAVDAMRGILDLLDMRGTVVIGEGEKDHAPMLAAGEHVGKWGRKIPKFLSLLIQLTAQDLWPTADPTL